MSSLGGRIRPDHGENLGEMMLNDLRCDPYVLFYCTGIWAHHIAYFFVQHCGFGLGAAWQFCFNAEVLLFDQSHECERHGQSDGRAQGEIRRPDGHGQGRRHREGVAGVII